MLLHNAIKEGRRQLESQPALSLKSSEMKGFKSNSGAKALLSLILDQPEGGLHQSPGIEGGFDPDFPIRAAR